MSKYYTGQYLTMSKASDDIYEVASTAGLILGDKLKDTEVLVTNIRTWNNTRVIETSLAPLWVQSGDILGPADADDGKRVWVEKNIFRLGTGRLLQYNVWRI